MSSSTPVSYRQHGALAIAALVVFVGALPLAGLRWYLLPLLLVPLLAGAWLWRSGTDADAEGLWVRALLGRRRIRWSEVAELAGDPRGRAMARLTDGRVIRLTAVPATELARLAGASGQRVSGAGGQTRTGEPDVDRPGADGPGADGPDADGPDVGNPGVDRPGVDRPGPAGAGPAGQ